MRRWLIAVVTLALLLCVAGVTVTYAGVVPGMGPASGAARADTPEPTPRPTPRPTKRPVKTPEPGETPAPSLTPVPCVTPVPSIPPAPLPSLEPGTSPVPLASLEPGTSPEPAASPVPCAPPEVTSITIGYHATDLAGSAPLLLAIDRGYFTAAGFTDVQLLQAQEPLPGLLDGQLAFAVLQTLDAVNAATSGLPIVAIAGYRNDLTNLTATGGDLVAADSDFAAQNPNTVIAFTTAYIRALADLRDPAGYEALFTLATNAGIPLDAAMLADWPAQQLLFAPFDGGFGDVADGGGLGQLARYLAANLAASPDLPTFIAIDSLNAAQAQLGLPPDPDPAALIPVPGASDAPAASTQPSVTP